MQAFNNILLGNKVWSDEKKKLDPDYFVRLNKDQTPEFLWIGCADSRVPANEVTNTDPGDIFVHRNIANLVIHSDLNVMSVLQYAVEHLKVSHVIVCGHYNCGGIKAAMTNKDFGLLNRWIMPIKETYIKNQQILEAEEDLTKRANMLAEFSANEQLYNIARTVVVQQSWKASKAPYLHSCIYDMEHGILKVLKTIDPENPQLPSIFSYQF